jgi:hypothetical protein
MPKTKRVVMANQNDPCEIFFRNSILRSRYPTATKLGELSQFFFAIFASVQFAFDRFKSFDGFIYIFQAVNSCWNQTQNNHALRYNRVNHNAAEYVENLNNRTLLSILETVPVEVGDVFGFSLQKKGQDIEQETYNNWRLNNLYYGIR